jgi:hypothetical protein
MSFLKPATKLHPSATSGIQISCSTMMPSAGSGTNRDTRALDTSNGARHTMPIRSFGEAQAPRRETSSISTTTKLWRRQTMVKAEAARGGTRRAARSRGRGATEADVEERPAGPRRGAARGPRGGTRRHEAVGFGRSGLRRPGVHMCDPIFFGSVDPP